MLTTVPATEMTVTTVPWPWWVAGLIIGLLVPVLYYLFNVSLSVSTGFASIIKAAFPRTELKWFSTAKFNDRWSWRLFFTGGMVLGAIIANVLGGGLMITLDMGILTSSLPWSTQLVGMFLLGAGFLIGFGARLARGCTSGHSIHGIATLQSSSIIVTILFLAFGALSANLVRILLFGGVG